MPYKIIASNSKAPMKLLHLLYSGLGGHGNVFFSLVEADTEKQFEYEALFNGVENIRQEYIEKCAQHKIHFNYVRKSPGIDINYYRQIIHTIKISNPSVIFLHSSSYILPVVVAVFFYRVKSKIIVRETQANNLKTKKEWLWLSIALVFADKCVFLSENFSRETKKKLPFLFKEIKTCIIPNGINLEKFSSRSSPKSNDCIIGMQSRIIKNKNHETLIRAFALLLSDDTLQNKNVLLKIAGDGEYLPTLQMLVKELKIEQHVVFTGVVNDGELVDFLSELDIYVHASLGETMSTSIMQAMACGKAIIASDVAGINNMVTNNITGILVPAKNAAILHEKLKLLITMPEFKMQLAQNAALYASQNFSNKVMLSKYRNLFYS